MLQLFVSNFQTNISGKKEKRELLHIFNQLETTKKRESESEKDCADFTECLARWISANLVENSTMKYSQICRTSEELMLSLQHVSTNASAKL